MWDFLVLAVGLIGALASFMAEKETKKGLEKFIQDEVEKHFQ